VSTPHQSIRPAVLADAALLADLGIRTFRETFESLVSPANLQLFLDLAYGEARQRAELADPSRPGLVLELDGRPVGFAQLRLGHREPGVTGARPVELQRIYVLREAQGSRCGAALMTASLALARTWGADQVWLGVWEHNAKALAFYARWGFREAGEHLFTIGSQVDRDLILVKDLP
jgi:GNAT superfamily N-acetyltransferase